MEITIADWIIFILQHNIYIFNISLIAVKKISAPYFFLSHFWSQGCVSEKAVLVQPWVYPESFRGGVFSPKTPTWLSLCLGTVLVCPKCHCTQFNRHQLENILNKMKIGKEVQRGSDLIPLERSDPLEKLMITSLSAFIVITVRTLKLPTLLNPNRKNWVRQ